ncbi:MAG: ATP-binding protein [Bacteroidetes bacterium]|nr:ATP-binding protein [Bacteroidota bacterium]
MISDCKKIVIIGPESTGKSTLSNMLATSLKSIFVPEFARTYLEQLPHQYAEQDLITIAQGQLQSEDSMLLQANQYLICDTDLYVIKVWSEHKYNRCDSWILQQIAKRKYDLYLLTDIDIPWQDDPLREHPDAAMRLYFFAQYQDIVVNSGVPFYTVQGSPEERLNAALLAIHQIN